MFEQGTALQSQTEESIPEVSLGAEIDRLAMQTVLFTAALVGVWTVARIGMALYVSGGPVELFRAWLTTVSGTSL